MGRAQDAQYPLCLIFLGGSYMAESFRSGLEAVSQTQHEVGLSIGLTPFQVFRYVVLPQAVAVALRHLVLTSSSLSRKRPFSQR